MAYIWYGQGMGVGVWVRCRGVCVLNTWEAPRKELHQNQQGQSHVTERAPIAHRIFTEAFEEEGATTARGYREAAPVIRPITVTTEDVRPSPSERLVLWRHAPSPHNGRLELSPPDGDDGGQAPTRAQCVRSGTSRVRVVRVAEEESRRLQARRVSL